MTTVGRKGEGPRDDGMTEERSSARDRAHWLVKEVQDRVPGAADEVTALIARARNSSWPEVLRAALYADAVARLVANDGNFRQAVDRLRQQAELDGEPVMEALASRWAPGTRSTVATRGRRGRGRRPGACNGHA